MSAEKEEYQVFTPELVVAEFYDHLNQQTVKKIGMREMSGRFFYMEEYVFGNGGDGMRMYSISPDNLNNVTPYSLAYREKLIAAVKDCDETYSLVISGVKVLPVERVTSAITSVLP
jgi:hypothetical protein